MNSPYTFSISFNNSGLSYGSTSEHIHHEYTGKYWIIYVPYVHAYGCEFCSYALGFQSSSDIKNFLTDSR